MKKIYVNYDNENYVTQYSPNDTDLKEAFIEDNFEIKFGYTRVKEEDGKLILYNDNRVKEQYYIDEEKLKAKQEILSQIEGYKQELFLTDYVVSKISEAQFLGEDTTELLNRYSDILSNRKLIRAQINELEEQLERSK